MDQNNISLEENCSLCNNSLCWSEEQYQEYLYYTQVSYFEIFIIFINVSLVVGGVAGNVLVILSVATCRNLQTVVNLFLVNLALADILVLIICAPVSILQDVTNTWIFGTVMCRTVIFSQNVSMSVSVLTLTAIAYDRYKAICRPLSRLSYSTLRHVLQLVSIWILSTLISLPECLVLHAVSAIKEQPCVSENVFWDLTNCIPFWSYNTGLGYGVVKTMILFINPLIIMIIIYSRIINKLWSDKVKVSSDNPGDNCQTLRRNTRRSSSVGQDSSSHLNNTGQCEKRKKAALMLVTLVCVFFITNLPVHLFNILVILNDFMIPEHYQSQVESLVAHGQIVGHTMCYINSAINPFIFYTMSQAFKKQFELLLRCGCCRLRSRNEIITLTSVKMAAAPPGSANINRRILNKQNSEMF